MPPLARVSRQESRHRVAIRAVTEGTEAERVHGGRDGPPAVAKPMAGRPGRPVRGRRTAVSDRRVAPDRLFDLIPLWEEGCPRGRGVLATFRYRDRNRDTVSRFASAFFTEGSGATAL
jgi:hypothetical protein